jgi:dienelactone hydrolase
MSAPSDPPPLPPFLEARRQGLTYPMAFRRDADPARWQDRLRAAWLAALPPIDGLPEVTGAGTLTFRFPSGAEAEGFLVLPPGPGPHPAILLLHDHGGSFDVGWRKNFDLPEAQAGLSRHYGGRAPSDALLAHGLAVLSVDALGWGARQAGGHEGQQALAANAMQLGWSLAGIVAAEDVQAARWLASHPAIDPTRVGAMGFSLGGFRAWQVAALSPEIRAAASLSWMARRLDLLAPSAPLTRGQSAFYMLHPLLAALADFPDMAGLAAPKPILLRSGEGDPHMPVRSVLAAWDQMARIWHAAGGPLPDFRLHPGGHVCPPEIQDEAARFLARHLA